MKTKNVSFSRFSLLAGLALGLASFDHEARPEAGSPGDSQRKAKYRDWEKLVADTRAASVQARNQALRRTVARDSCWPHGAWGDTLWALSALYLNERANEANARLLKRAGDYIALKRTHAPVSEFKPEGAKETPWAYFALTDYVRILSLFRSGSDRFPGRLTAETEAAMKEALWLWAKADSRVADASLDNLLVLLGTENHDLTRRPNHYLVASILKDDPAFAKRRYDDGHTPAEHAAAYAAYFREWPRQRARTGLWFELGSDTYQKYSWPALFNLHELAPDPVVRRRFGLLLDLALIEEAQISVQGRRGGGRSRAGYGENAFESSKNLLYAPKDARAGSSHSRVIETSLYQPPPAAVLLRKVEFPAAGPFLIRNRVLGELEPGETNEGEGRRHAEDSALVNYAWRTRSYLLGSSLQNPALTMPDPENGQPTLKYAGISRQKRWCGMLFDAASTKEICAVYPVIEKTRGGRPQRSFWSAQHENLLLLQRIAPESRRRIGSYSTGRISIHFHGRLNKIEDDGWIFADNGKAFVGVRFLDGGHVWDERRETASPAAFDPATNTSRILLTAGDITSHGSFEKFQTATLANPLRVSRDRVEYEFGSNRTRLDVTRFDGDHPEHFELPKIDGKPIDLRPTATWQSPYLNGRFGGDLIAVTVGPVKDTLDFSR